MVEYESIKTDLYNCFNKSIHDTVVYLKDTGKYGEEFDGNNISPLMITSKNDHLKEYPELYPGTKEYKALHPELIEEII